MSTPSGSGIEEIEEIEEDTVAEAETETESEKETETGTETNRENKQTAVIKTFHGHIYHIWILILILTRGFLKHRKTIQGWVRLCKDI
jgi:hypothetical protein